MKRRVFKMTQAYMMLMMYLGNFGSILSGVGFKFVFMLNMLSGNGMVNIPGYLNLWLSHVFRLDILSLQFGFLFLRLNHRDLILLFHELLFFL